MSIRKGTSIIAGNISQNIDSELSLTSNNPVKNSVITNKLEQTLDYKNITNCITEIPQDINLTLSDGTLTLVSGSKLYLPNGVGIFDDYTTTQNYNITQPYDGTYLVFFNGSSLFTRDINKCFSGTEPTPVQTYSAWYDTANNLIKYTTNSTTWQTGLYLPIAQVMVSGGVISSIDQVFNGFGYIGSTKFILPGVKGLIPNGRNTDGTLKNTVLVITEVKTFTGASTDSTTIGVVGNNSITNYHTPELSYNAESNYMIHSGDIIDMIPYTNSYSQVNGKIDPGITFKQAFHAVDYNDTECMTKGALSNIVNGADKKVGDVYYTTATNNTSVYAPSGGKWLILYVVEVNISTAVLYLYSDDLYHKVGEIVNGGTQITQARNGYGAYVSLLKIA